MMGLKLIHASKMATYSSAQYPIYVEVVEGVENADMMSI